MVGIHASKCSLSFPGEDSNEQNADVLAGRVYPPVDPQKLGPFIVINGVMGKWPYK